MEPTGLLVFSIIKYVGYLVFFKIFNTNRNYVNPFLASLIRLVIGFIVGSAILYFSNAGRESILEVYFSATLIGRIIIWYSLLHFLYKKIDRKRLFWGMISGVVLSYILDIPALLGLWYAVGGIC
jgi:Na+/melibiose symporter-like transporter